MQLKSTSILFSLLLLFACDKTDDNSESETKGITPVAEPNTIEIKSPSEGVEFSTESSFDYSVNVMKDERVDSVHVFINDKKLLTKQGTISLDSLPLGENLLKVRAFLKNGKVEVRSSSFIKLSNILPQEYSYEVINIYEHNPDDYTQGLEFSEGLLYESTGQYGESFVKVWDPVKGKEIASRPLEDAYFGEGLTVINDKVYQLTWRENIGFVYDKKSLALLQSFSYPGEGWGLTHDGQHLIVSDGSNKLTFVNPKNFQVAKTIQVFDDVSGVYDLNELEYIDGDIYANVYRTNLVVIIDPVTGKVKGRINLQGLLNTVKVEDEVDVLNGIAYDQKTKKLYVTGKWWPAIFEIKLVEAQDN